MNYFAFTIIDSCVFIAFKYVVEDSEWNFKTRGSSWQWKDDSNEEREEWFKEGNKFSGYNCDWV